SILFKLADFEHLKQVYYSSLQSIEEREDVQLLKRSCQHVPSWWGSCAKQVQTYLTARACDLARYGKEAADRKFPPPILTGVSARQIEEALEGMVAALQATWRRKEEQDKERVVLQTTNALPLHIGSYLESKKRNMWFLRLAPHVVINNKRIFLPDHLPPRVLSAPEREEVRLAC